MNIKVSLVALATVSVLTLFGGSSTYAAEKKDQAKKPTEVTVQAGDTLEKIATAHGTDYVRLYNANAALVSPDLINEGDTIRLPGKDEQLPDRFSEYQAAVAAAQAAYVAPVNYGYNYSYTQPSYASNNYATTYSGGSTAGNTYAWGNCTWYAKNMRPDLPNMLGNGGSWSANAAAQGYSTGAAPKAGAVAEQNGHVAYVESVNGGNVTVSEMNWNGGVGQVNRRTVPAGSFNSYIY